MRKILLAAGTLVAFGAAGIAFAQTTLPEGVSEAQMEAAFKDLSAVYGAPVARLDQAKAICNEEQYLADCAEIGKKRDLFSGDRAKQVDTLLTEIRGAAVEKLKQCGDAACLVEVATSIASRLNSKNPAIAKAMELTPAKVKEKREIVETAKSLGVDMEACRTMDPETASVELLRGCARLAKHENVQKYITPEGKERVKEADAAIELKESLASGELTCGDNTLEGCGNFCLTPSPESSVIPPVCRAIASRFFGQKGIGELERAYTTVQETFDTFAERAKNTVFTTADGRTFTEPAAIGKYMEEAGGRGDVEAVARGMDFLRAKGLVTSQDRDFALTMVRKIKERGPVNFDICREDPSSCADIVPEEERDQFSAMGEVDKIVRGEMAARGIDDPSRCSSDSAIGASCLEAARAALPQIERLAETSPQARTIVTDIRQKVRFGEAGLDARARVEERFKSTGDVSIGDRRFGSLREVDTFCQANSQQCLAETVREGLFSKDIAAEKYERVINVNYNYNFNQPRTEAVAQLGQAGPVDQMRQPTAFNKEEALQQFKQWLDNPTGAPPIPPGMELARPPQYSASPYTQYPPPYPSPYSPYPRSEFDQKSCQYAASMPPPCRTGEYRQESVSEFGCPVFGACIPILTQTEPPRPDGKQICPALPTVESCPSGEERFLSYSSPECGTYYGCRAVNKVDTTNQNQIVSSCEQRYGSGWRSVDSSGNCFNSSVTEYRTASGTLHSCSTAPVYGCNASDVPPAPNPYPTPYPYPSGQRDQIWNSLGLRSSIRSDADTARIESLKQACASVSSQANVWLPGAGTSSSADFGMPDPAKCARAAACTSTQYFNGSDCAASGNFQTSCPSGQYWSGSACVTSTTQTTTTGSCSSELINLLGSGCHTMGNGWFDSNMTSYVLTGSQTVRSCATEYVSGCSGGTPYTQTQTSCASGQYWNGSACVSSTQTTQTSASCPSGQWWNGSSCTSATSGTDYASAQQGCANVGGMWDSSSNYCRMPNTTTSCGSGQYWNGSACVTSTTQTQTSTSCGSGQYWNGSACVATSPYDTVPTDTTSMQQSCASAGGTWDSASNYCRMPSTSTYTAPSSETYTAPSSDTYTPPPAETYTPPPTESAPPPAETYTPPPVESTPPPTESAPISYLFCPDGHTWNGAYCVLSPRSPFERYTASVWAAAKSLLGL